MKFVVRDDDTYGFTRVEELQDCYRAGVQTWRIDISMHAYLEQWLDTRVRNFVPPHNMISLDALQAVIAMNLVNIPSLVRRALGRKKIQSLPDLAGYVWHCKVRRHCYPHVLATHYHLFAKQNRDGESVEPCFSTCSMRQKGSWVCPSLASARSGEA